MRLSIGLLFIITLSFPLVGIAEQVFGTTKARVLEVVAEEQFERDNTDWWEQTLEAEIIEGAYKGKQITLESSLFHLRKGDTFYLNYTFNDTGEEYYSVDEPNRYPALYLFVALFVLTVLIFGGMQGTRALLSLLFSFIAIFSVLLPLIIRGFPPVLTSVAVALLIVSIVMPITHGWNRKTLAAYLSTVGVVFVTSILSWFGMWFAHLTGIISGETAHLVGLPVDIDPSGIFLAGIIIGMLGILDDIAITQASAVEALQGLGLTSKELFARAYKIGKEHVGAAVNTLFLAYTGVALPFLILLFFSTSTWEMLINQEAVIAEVMRASAGSIGLVLAVPITTLLAVALQQQRAKQKTRTSKP